MHGLRKVDGTDQTKMGISLSREKMFNSSVMDKCTQKRAICKVRCIEQVISFEPACVGLGNHNINSGSQF